MSRIVALDVGRKRTGVAVTDILQIVPGGLGCFSTQEIPERIAEYCLHEPVERIVVGLPTQADNTPSESERYIIPILNRLHKLIPDTPIERYDERYTTILAHRAMIEGGLSKAKRREKGKADELSAVIILRDYLESKALRKT